MKDKEFYFKDLKDKVDNIFVLINLAGKRARELISGAPKLIQTECNDPIQIALEEIVQGKITFGKKKEEPTEKKKKNKSKRKSKER